MSIITKGRRISDEDTELNMIPIMNIFLVIIPFLLTSVSFFHIKAISTSVPVMADSTHVSVKAEKIKLTVILEMRQADMRLSATAEELHPQELEQFEQLFKLQGEHYLFLKNCLPRDEVHLVFFENKSAYSFSWRQSLFYQKFHCI